MSKILLCLLLLPLHLTGQRTYVGSFLMSQDSVCTTTYDQCYLVENLPTLYRDTLVVIHQPFTSYFPTTYMFAVHTSRHQDDQVRYSSRLRTHYSHSTYYAIATRDRHPYNIKIVRTGLYTTIWITPITFNRLHRFKDLRGFCITDDHHLVKTAFPNCNLR